MHRLTSTSSIVLKKTRLQTLGTTLMVASLLILTVILGGVVAVTEYSVQSLEEKLGFYFYLEETIDDEVGASALLQLTQDLESIGLRPTYYSKDQAFERMARSLPDVIDDLEKYEIGNPLPPTLYVPFASRESYDLLRNVVLEYEDFISNSSELNSQIAFGTQEQRVQSVLAASQTMKYIVIGLLISLIVIMAAFVAYGNTTHLTKFAEQLRLEKLLGASWFQRVVPFFVWTWVVWGGASLVGGGVLWWLIGTIDASLAQASDSVFQGLLDQVDFETIYQYAVGVVLIVSTVVTTVMTAKRH